MRQNKGWNKWSPTFKRPGKQLNQSIEKLCKQSEVSKSLLKQSKLSCKVSAFSLVSKQIGKLKRNYWCVWMISLLHWKSTKRTVSLKIVWWNWEITFKSHSLKRKYCLRKSEKCFKLHSGVKPLKSMQRWPGKLSQRKEKWLKCKLNLIWQINSLMEKWKFWRLPKTKFKNLRMTRHKWWQRRMLCSNNYS